jgi:hypothetical protein
MDSHEIQQQLDTAVRRLLDKGVGQPSVTLQFRSEGECLAQVCFYEAGEYEVKSFWAPEPGVALNQVWNLIREMPDLAERERTLYLKKVAEAVEYGRKVGVDQALINPLLEQMKKLSSNIIEHKPSLDDIPF